MYSLFCRCYFGITMRNEIDPKYDFEVKLDFSDYGGGGRKD